MAPVAFTATRSKVSSERPVILPSRRHPQNFPEAPNPILSARSKGAFMKAVCWMGKEKMQVHDVPDPKILNPRDAIVRITSTCICGSDLHLYDGFVPTLEPG